MKKLTILIMLMAATFVSAAEADSLKVLGDSAFAKEDFKTAVTHYKAVAEMGESAAVCYNLGCCYYRLDDMARSVLWFERAALLDPSDEDIRFNLDMARSKTIDHITPRHEMFFTAAWHSMTSWLSADEWATWAVSFFVGMLLFFFMYFFSSDIVVRKIGFFGALLSLVVVLLTNALAYSQRKLQVERSGAIVMTPAVTVKSTPSKSGTELFVLHEGTRVEILDNTMKEWVEIQIADGKVGWMEREQLEQI
ncbi:MAG: tetratricopeptide repeat protein [Bacteroidaceae bacterium]|nr:tetratricopeptide repeat protein [Bacteroidaceae bacterium]